MIYDITMNKPDLIHGLTQKISFLMITLKLENLGVNVRNLIRNSVEKVEDWVKTYSCKQCVWEKVSWKEKAC